MLINIYPACLIINSPVFEINSEQNAKPRGEPLQYAMSHICDTY